MSVCQKSSQFLEKCKNPICFNFKWFSSEFSCKRFPRKCKSILYHPYRSNRSSSFAASSSSTSTTASPSLQFEKTNYSRKLRKLPKVLSNRSRCNYCLSLSSFAFVPSLNHCWFQTIGAAFFNSMMTVEIWNDNRSNYLSIDGPLCHNYWRWAFLH